MTYEDCYKRTQTYLGSSDRRFQPCKNSTGECYVDFADVRATSLSIYPSIYLSIHLYTHLSIYLYLYLYPYLYLYLNL